jgi:predicted DNA-binding transcriptional regulator YafY
MKQAVDQEKCVNIVYTNWRGETGTRKIIPEKVFFGATEWHPENQWLLHAYDVEKEAFRDFALKDIASWKP